MFLLLGDFRSEAPHSWVVKYNSSMFPFSICMVSFFVGFFYTFRSLSFGVDSNVQCEAWN